MFFGMIDVSTRASSDFVINYKLSPATKLSRIELVCTVDHNIFTTGSHISNSTDHHINTQYSPHMLGNFYYHPSDVSFGP